MQKQTWELTREPELSQILMLTNTKAKEVVNKYEVFLTFAWLDQSDILLKNLRVNK